MAIAVAVLAGALVVGDSVRASLRELAVSRLGRTDHLDCVDRLFPRALARDLEERRAFQSRLRATSSASSPSTGWSRTATSGARASNVAIYGVDERFWQFHGKPLAGEAARAGARRS